MKTIQVTDDDIVELTHILIAAKNVNNRMENESKNDGKRAYLHGCADGLMTARDEIDRWWHSLKEQQ